MPKHIDPEAVAQRIRESIGGSRRRERRARCRRVMEEFGFQHVTTSHVTLVGMVLRNCGILVTPSLLEAEKPHRDTWLHLTLAPPEALPPVTPPVRPHTEWFDHLRSLKLESEREVELHFISPLFHALGYDDEHEAIGYRLTAYEGVKLTHPEADFIYFESANHALDPAPNPGNPLILVECKTPDHLDGLGQVRSYAFWVKPVYYVVTNGDTIAVYLYQGGAVPDAKMIEVKRETLEEQFDDLHRLLARENAIVAKQQAIEHWRIPGAQPAE